MRLLDYTVFPRQDSTRGVRQVNNSCRNQMTKLASMVTSLAQLKDARAPGNFVCEREEKKTFAQSHWRYKIDLRRLMSAGVLQDHLHGFTSWLLNVFSAPHIMLKCGF